jgi:hypothetical protein
MHELGIGHDGRWVRVDQHHLVAELRQRLRTLGSRVVELARLADHDRAGTDEENLLNVVATGHREPV